ncbi:hypothetical protein [Pedococcus sp.]|uniref:hypothetical protein n=1 Tax=Pedococcus sp. TaxID=2860345 RepID=UPI002E14BE4E|nr:hypothetical protein [Pedococcus sp.]
MSPPPVPPFGSGRDRERHPRPEADLDDPTGVRALLGALPAPGPMPADLVARISSSIAAEQEARAGTPVIAIESRRRLRWQRLGLAAAAAAIAVVALPALLSSGPASWLASLSPMQHGSQVSAGSAASLRTPPGAPSSAAVGQGGGSVAGTLAAPRIYASGTAYTRGAFPQQVRAFLAHPGTPLAPLAAESPAMGPAATPRGLAPCLAMLRLDPAAQVSADVASFDGRSAVVVMVHTVTAQIAYAVDRRCTSGAGAVLAGPLHVG